MKQGILVRSAFAAAFTLALAGTAVAGQKPVSSEQAAPPAAAAAPACKDSGGKPVTDVSVCASGACTDSSGKPVTDPSVCASVSGKPSTAGWDLKSNTK